MMIIPMMIKFHKPKVRFSRGASASLRAAGSPPELCLACVILYLFRMRRYFEWFRSNDFYLDKSDIDSLCVAYGDKRNLNLTEHDQCPSIYFVFRLTRTSQPVLYIRLP